MGTRSKIILNSKTENKTLVIYKHWDGYPSDNLNMFLNAFKDAKCTDDFIKSCSIYYGRENMVEQEFLFTENPIWRSDYQLQGDLEYFYIVNFDEKNIDIYGHEYGTEREHFAHGKIHPITEIDSYMPEYKAQYKAKIEMILDGLKNAGINLNNGLSDSRAAANQLREYKKSLRDTETRLYEKSSELDELERRVNFINKAIIHKMTAKQLKEFFELSGIKIKKITKCKTEREFNLYLDDNGNFKDSCGRTAWQLTNALGYFFDLKLNIK